MRRSDEKIIDFGVPKGSTTQDWFTCKKRQMSFVAVLKVEAPVQ